MATLTSDELRKLRNHSERLWNEKNLGAITYTKAQVNTAFQALEDHFETTARTGVQKKWKTEMVDTLEDDNPGLFDGNAKTILIGVFLIKKAQIYIDAL